MSNYRISNMERKELDECVEVFIDTFSQESWNDKFDSKEQVYCYFNDFFSNNYFVGYVLRLGTDIVGLSIGFKKPWIVGSKGGIEYYIDQFCVRKEFQGKGVGSYFIELIEKDLNEKNINAMILNTEKGYPSEAFYQKNGFDKLEELIVLAK